MTDEDPPRLQPLLEDLHRELGEAIRFRRECIEQKTSRSTGRSYHHAGETVVALAEAIARIAGVKRE